MLMIQKEERRTRRKCGKDFKKCVFGRSWGLGVLGVLGAFWGVGQPKALSPHRHTIAPLTPQAAGAHVQVERTRSITACGRNKQSHPTDAFVHPPILESKTRTSSQCPQHVNAVITAPVGVCELPSASPLCFLHRASDGERRASSCLGPRKPQPAASR